MNPLFKTTSPGAYPKRLKGDFPSLGALLALFVLEGRVDALIEGGQWLIDAREENYGGRNHTSARQ